MTTAEMLKSKPGVRGATIITRSGAYFDFLNPDPETIHIEDIAWALAFTCRFGGQSLFYYSVAQHSVLVSEIVPVEIRLAALLHDAAEAYVGDVVGPLKQLLPDYKIVEKRVEAAVAARFGVPVEMHPEIKHADLRLLRTEQRDLTSGHADNWNGLDAYPPLKQTIMPETPESAARNFLNRFHALTTYTTQGASGLKADLDILSSVQERK